MTSADNASIGQHREPPPRSSALQHKLGLKGVFDRRRVRLVSFSVISIGLFGTALLCVLAIWDYATRDTAWRALATLGVLAATAIIFTLINEMFGAKTDA